MGISADLISRSRYTCGKPVVKDLTNGFVIKPIYRDELLKNADTTNGELETLIGTVPSQLRKEMLEGNFIIVNSNSVCYYTFVIDIERAKLELLPTGLYADTLMQQDFTNASDTGAVIFYSIKKTITLPFRKGTAAFLPADIQQLKDSLGNGKYSIRHLDLRAYSSVEGTEEVNRQLMQQRAIAVQKAIQTIAPGDYTTNILPAENWIEFTREAIPVVPQLAGLSKQAIKQQLQDKDLLARLEPILSKHRKAVITVWLDGKTRVDALPNDALLPAYNKSAKEKKLDDCRRILKEISVRISQNRLPEDYIDQVIVPTSPDFYTLESDKAVYEYYLGKQVENQALYTLYELKSKHPNDPHLLFNICVLELVQKKYDVETDIDTTVLKANIHRLSHMGIHPSLVTRLLINFNIIQSEAFMRMGEYEAKDDAVQYIWDQFQYLDLNDQSRYLLAKFFENYSRGDLAMATVLPRVDQLDASENIVFYFVNLGFFHPEFYENKYFKDAMLNAANLNRARFCQFFMPYDYGGASMQLMEYELLKKYKCESCPN